MSADPGEQRMLYRIVVKGHLDEKWGDWFDGMNIKNLPDGRAVLSGLILDQAELHGLLAKVRDLGLSLVSVGPEKSDR